MEEYSKKRKWNKDEDNQESGMQRREITNWDTKLGKYEVIKIKGGNKN